MRWRIVLIIRPVKSGSAEGSASEEPRRERFKQADDQRSNREEVNFTAPMEDPRVRHRLASVKECINDKYHNYPCYKGYRYGCSRYGVKKYCWKTSWNNERSWYHDSWYRMDRGDGYSKRCGHKYDCLNFWKSLEAKVPDDQPCAKGSGPLRNKPCRYGFRYFCHDKIGFGRKCYAQLDRQYGIGAYYMLVGELGGHVNDVDEVDCTKDEDCDYAEFLDKDLREPKMDVPVSNWFNWPRRKSALDG